MQKFLGTHPDKMDDEVYSTTFEVFKSQRFVSPSTNQPSQNGRRPPVDPIGPRAEENEAEADKPVDPRVKELYRRLVRRLHPDSRKTSGDPPAAVSGLWHEVQEAYAAADVARMELLLALSDLSERLGVGTTFSQMQSVRAELNRSVRALEKSLREAEGEDAWNFARVGPSEDLRLRVERQLKHDLSLRQDRLDLLSQTIADWAQGPTSNPKFRPIQVSRVA